MAGVRPRVRFTVKLLSREARLREKLRVYREELSRLKEEGGPAWVVSWYEERVRLLEEELQSLSGSSSGSSSSQSKGKK